MSWKLRYVVVLLSRLIPFFFLSMSSGYVIFRFVRVVLVVLVRASIVKT